MAFPFNRTMNPVAASLRPIPPKPGVSRKEVVEQTPTETKIEVEETESAPMGDDLDPKIVVGYSGPEERCKACAHFEGGKCGMHDFECDPEGTCMDFEAGAYSELPEGGEPSVEIEIEPPQGGE